MDIIKIISISVSALVIIVLLKKFNKDYSVTLSCLVGTSICLFSLGILIPVFDYLKNFSDSTYSELYTIIFKSAGICMLSSFAAELCRDCGEASLGTKIEFAGKCTLLSFCLPILQRVFENAKMFMD